MAELKTRPTGDDVEAHLAAIEDARRREDCRRILEIMRRATGVEPRMWGSSIVGFGEYHYVYASGREGDWFEVGFASRKRNIAVYVMPGLEGLEQILGRLGDYSTGVGCLYLKRLADVDVAVLEELVAAAVRRLRE